jgi:hypothetical protein
MAEVQQWLEILSSKQLETQATLEGIQDKWDLWTKATAGEEQKKPGVNANYGINKLRSQLKMRVNLQAKLHAALKDKIVKHDVSSSTTSLTPKPGVEDAASDGPFGVKAVVDDVTTSEDEQHRLCDLTAESLRGRMLDLLASFAKSIGPDAGPEVK